MTVRNAMEIYQFSEISKKQMLQNLSFASLVPKFVFSVNDDEAKHNSKKHFDAFLLSQCDQNNEMTLVQCGREGQGTADSRHIKQLSDFSL